MRRDIQLEVVRRITASIYCPPSKPGEFIWVSSEEAARHLVEGGFCRWLNGSAKRPGPTERPAAGPSETKEVVGVHGGKPLRLPDGWPVDRFAVVERAWDGETVVCLGGGPSLTPEVVEIVAAEHARNAVRAIAINDSYLIAPWADICYFADSKWWDWHTRGTPKPKLGLSAEDVAKRFRKFGGQKVTIENMGNMVADAAVFMLHNYNDAGHPAGLSLVPNGIQTGSNSGYQAINIAVLAGARRILLLGYDMHFPGGRSHWHGGHPSKHPENVYSRYASRFTAMLPDLQRLGVEVVNCTPESRIRCFRRADLKTELERKP